MTLPRAQPHRRPNDLRNRWFPSNQAVSRNRYDYDTLGRRTRVIRTGPAFGTEGSDVWTYNDRNELTVSERFDDTTVPLTSNPVATLDREYDYDPIADVGPRVDIDPRPAPVIMPAMHPLLDAFETVCRHRPARPAVSDQSLTLDYQSLRAVSAPTHPTAHRRACTQLDEFNAC